MQIMTCRNNVSFGLRELKKPCAKKPCCVIIVLCHIMTNDNPQSLF